MDRSILWRARTYFAVVLTTALLMFWTPRVYPQAADPEAAIKQVVVWNGARGARSRIGTAFHVGGGLFYTNAHIARAKVPDGFNEWYLASTNSGETPETWLGPLTVSCVHAQWQGARDTSERAWPNDVATFKAPSIPADLPALSLDTRNPQPGRRATVRGFAAASRTWPPTMYTARGRVDEVALEIQAFSVAIESGFAMSGSSGSPVFGEDGRVQGVLFGALNPEGRAASELVVAVLAKSMLDGCPQSR
jgi:V8-like Glu-specific endopeptidase